MGHGKREDWIAVTAALRTCDDRGIRLLCVHPHSRFAPSTHHLLHAQPQRVVHEQPLVLGVSHHSRHHAPFPPPIVRLLRHQAPHLPNTGPPALRPRRLHRRAQLACEHGSRHARSRHLVAATICRQRGDVVSRSEELRKRELHRVVAITAGGAHKHVTVIAHGSHAEHGRVVCGTEHRSVR